MTRYVVGLAGGAETQAALEWATTQAGERDEIVVLHAWEIPVVTGYESVAAIDTEAIEESAADYVATVLRERGDDRITGKTISGHPGQSIVDLAEESAARGEDVVIVVGHAGSSKVGLLLGSTANYVVHHAHLPVVVVRGDVRVPVRTVVVGVDEPHEDHPDEPSIVALRWALRLPGATRVEVHHAAFVPGVAAGPVTEPAIESAPEADEIDVHLQAAIDAALEGETATAEIVPVVDGGKGGFALIEASRTADLIVVGTRGHRSLRQLITGSTTLEVLAHSRCPVAVVR
jgi:nucleotide-binding universal stress UspA family protein